MNKRIRVGLSAGILHRLVIAAILSVFASQAFDATAQMETVLYSFGNSTNDGVYPFTPLVQGSDGNFYGTTTYGGGSGTCMDPITNSIVGCGTVFRIGPSGSETDLYFFGSYPTDGMEPYGGLVQGSDGGFYGTTIGGGTSNNGTVFRIDSSGSYTNLYSFKGVSFETLPRAALVQGGDGSQPGAGLVQGSDGNFYGTTIGGGAGYAGTVFRMSPSGTETILYSFSYPDGVFPQAALVQGTDSNFYGTTFLGGTHGWGTVFRVSPSGTFTSLYSFGSGSDGMLPQTALIQGSDGNFYGTTEEGGMYSNYYESCQCFVGDGVVFRISPSGSYTNLYSFGSQPNDGYIPAAGLVQGKDGNFYGTTLIGGTSTNCPDGCGTVFRISPSGSYASLYSFGNYPGGAYPAELVQGSDGNFYGTTEEGGTYNRGTVFKLCVPSGQPPVISGIAVTPNVLWPPDHKMVLVTVDYTTTENCGVADCELSATSNESDTSDSGNDIQLIPGDTHHVYLRAERSPSGSGRVYTITVTCTDTSGNVATKTAEVTVPHDQGEK